MRVGPLPPARSDRARDRLNWPLNSPGGTPNSRLNARLNAASESYPTSEATRITAARVVCSILAASCNRQGAADDRIPRPCKPAGLFRRQCLHVAANGFDEERLRHLGEQDRLSRSHE